jgi:hypothetical protein
METMDEIISKSPLLNPERLNKHAILSEMDNYAVDLNEAEEPQTEEEITENNAKNATVENIITLLLTDSAPGLTFSTVEASKQSEIERLNKWLRIKLFTKVNNQTLKDDFIRLARSHVPPINFALGYMVLLITHIFDFKNRIVRNAINEYNTWLSTRVNATYAIKEYDPGALPLLTKYWSATPTPPSPVDPSEPWSAAFISWVIKESGGMDLFEYSNAHIDYIRAAKRNRDSRSQNPFWLYSISDFITRMQPGDLLCKARSGSGLTFANVLINTDTAAHVDVITEIDRPNNRIRVVGGNVSDNVDHKGLNIVGTTRITNADGEGYFAGIGIGNA